MESPNARDATLHLTPDMIWRPLVSGGPNTPSLTATVAPSGQCLVVEFFDPTGKPTNVTAYAPAPSQIVNVAGASVKMAWTFGGQTTVTFPLGTPGATVQGYLQSLSSVGPGNVTVTGTLPYLVTFTGALAGTSQAPVSVSTAGSSGQATPVPTTAGSGGVVSLDASGSSFTLSGSAWNNFNPGNGTGYEVNATGTGLNQATWTFGGLATGNYQVLYSNPGYTITYGSSYASAPPYRLFDGSTYRGTYYGDHQVNSNYETINTQNSTMLGTVYVSSGTLSVTLTDQVGSVDIGKTIFANQISVIPIAPAAPVIGTAANPAGPNDARYAGTYYTSPVGWNNNTAVFTSSTTSATYTFQGLLPGVYSVQVLYPATASSTTNATYAVYTGATLLGTQTVNQKAAPASALSAGLTETDPKGNAYTFGVLGNFNVPGNGTSLTVVVSAGADGGSTQANAILLSLQAVGSYLEPVSSKVSVFSAGPPSVTTNGGAAVTLGTPIQGINNLVPYLIYPLTQTLGPADSLAFTLSSNIVTTSSGLVPGVTGQTAVNKVGGAIVPLPASGPQTMGVGWNPRIPGTTGNPSFLYSNYFKRIDPIGYIGADNPPPPLTPDGYPQFLHYDSWYANIGPWAINPIDPRGFPNLPASGFYTFMWDGGVGGELLVSPDDAHSIIAVVGENTGHATDNSRTFSVTLTGTTQFSPTIHCQILGLGAYLDDQDTGRLTYSGHWTPQTGSGWNNTYHQNDRTTASTATWNLGALPAGSWRLQPCFPVLTTNTAAAVYKVYEGTTLLTTVNVNQTQSVTGAIVGDSTGTTRRFASPFTVTTSGGTVTVVLSGGTDGYAIADCISFQLVGSLSSPVTPVTNIRCYTPGVDPANPGTFHPATLRQLQGASAIRSVVLLNGNSSSIVNFSDYAQGTELTYASLQGKNQTFPITEVQNWSDPSGFWRVSGGQYSAVLVTYNLGGLTTSPIINGMTVSFGIPNNIATNGSPLTLQSQYMAVEYNSATMAPNQFAAGFYTGTTRVAVTTTPVSPATSIGTITLQYQSIPPIDFVTLVNDLPGCAAWVNVSPIATQACITSLFDLIATNLAPGRLIYMEIANEPWNFAGGYTQFGYFYGLAAEQNSADPMLGYSIVATKMHAWATTALAAYGLQGQLRRVFNTQWGVTSTATTAVNYCTANNDPLDCIAVAPYLGNGPAQQAGLTAVYDGLNTAQIIDCQEMWVSVGSNMQSKLAAEVSSFSTAFPSAQLVCYEGGLPNANIGGDVITQAYQSQSAHFHPRTYNTMLGYLNILQAGGVSLFNYYNLDQVTGYDGTPYFATAYGAYLGCNMLPGLGDGTDGQYDSLPDLAGTPGGLPNLGEAVSPIGGAICTWNGVPFTAPGRPVRPHRPRRTDGRVHARSK